MKETTTFDARHFRDKFSAIPDNMWCCYALKKKNQNVKCANGHAGFDTMEYLATVEATGRMVLKNVLIPNLEANAFVDVFKDLQISIEVGPLGEVMSVNEVNWLDEPRYSKKAAIVNDGQALEYRQDTPKARILAALDDIIKQEEKGHQERNGIRTGKPAVEAEK